MAYMTIGLDNQVHILVNCSLNEACLLTRKIKLINQPKGITKNDRYPLIFKVRLVFFENGGYKYERGECLTPDRIKTFTEMQRRLGYTVTPLV
jgi:hypothetical protein